MTQPAPAPDRTPVAPTGEDPTHYRIRYAIQVVCGLLAFVGIAAHFLQGFGFDLLGIPPMLGNWLIAVGGLCGLASAALPSVLDPPSPERVTAECQVHVIKKLRKSAHL